MKFKELESDLHVLENTVAEINRQIAKSMSAGNGKICGSCELFFIAIARRTGAFTDAFCKAVRDDNHFVAPALIRPNLEHLLVIHAAGEYNPENIHEFTKHLLNGQRARDLKNQAGKKMVEKVLVSSLSILLDDRTNQSVEGLYEWCNKFTHFGPQLLFSPIQHIGDDGRFELVLYKPTFEIPAVKSNDVQDWIVAMKTVNLFICEYLSHWTDIKNGIWADCP